MVCSQVFRSEKARASQSIDWAIEPISNLGLAVVGNRSIGVVKPGAHDVIISGSI